MASQKAYKKAGVSPSDVQVVELHDCFSANELISYEALGLCDEGCYINSPAHVYYCHQFTLIFLSTVIGMTCTLTNFPNLEYTITVV